MDNDELLNVREAAEILGQAPRTVLKRAKAEEIPATKLGGATGAYVFRLPDVQAAKAADDAAREAREARAAS